MGIFFPVLEKSDIGVPAAAEVTDVVCNGLQWFCAVKEDGGENTAYSYKRFRPLASLPQLSPQERRDRLDLSDVRAEEYRAAREIVPFSRAPERLRALLASLPAGLQFQIDCLTLDGYAHRVYSQATDSKTPSLSATALLADSYALSLFSDGTLYFSGALPWGGAYHQFSAFRLPPLPAGFVYEYCVLNGGKLYASWKEADFYKTGRSGFIAVNLSAVLY
jgi:hypothetical protein